MISDRLDHLSRASCPVCGNDRETIFKRDPLSNDLVCREHFPRHHLTDACVFCGGPLRLVDTDRLGWVFTCQTCRKDTVYSDAAVVQLARRVAEHIDSGYSE